MRTRVIILLAVLGVALIVCTAVTRRSKNPLSHDLAYLLFFLLPPIFGNLLIIASSDWLVARIGSYLYYLGIDFTVVSLVRFAAHYCSIPWEGSKWRFVILAILGVDVVQLLLNPFLGHAFTTAEIMVEGTPYHSLVPFLWQNLHRAAVYGVFFISIGIFVYKTARTPRIYVERYLVILAVMVFTGAWETYYVISGSPIDRSMIGFGAFGLLVFYFTLYYRPIFLLDRMLASIVSDMNEAVFFFDRDKKCIYANAYGNALFGIEDMTELETLTPRLVSIVGADSFSFADEWVCERSIDSQRFKSEYESSNICLLPRHDNQRHLHFEFHKLRDDRGRFVGSFLRMRDRTEEQMRLEAERYNAIHDPLTGLYNFSYVRELVEDLIAAGEFNDYYIAAVDIREFKLVNDVYSRDFGDKVLCKLADAIRDFSTPGEIYGRISGDRFGFVIPKAEFNAEFVEKYLNNWDISEEGVNYSSIVHVGVYEVDDVTLPVTVMFDRAFMAIASIKHDHRNHIAFYDNKMRDNAIWNQKISSELDEAIATGQIVPYLQPIVNERGNVVGAEVLARWIHPEYGFLSPARFIPYFEENGRIAQLDQHMWECACSILSQWQKDGVDLFLSVNISPKDFFFLDVHKSISELVGKYDVDINRLRLEITETVMMSDVANRLRVIEELRSEGFIVEMDDFGSGYSSLNMLKDIPVDVLKIDMMFLYKTKDQGRAQTILQTIIDLSENLRIPSITEGVETAEQFQMLVRMGCRVFQGYYFAKPMSRDEFEETYNRAA